VVLGDHVWVQYCHSGCEVKSGPEYVFALNREHPRQGFFVPFYRHLLEQWSDHRHPEYDFGTGQLIYRDAYGKEIRRADFGGDGEPGNPGSRPPQTGPISSSGASRNAAPEMPVSR